MCRPPTPPPLPTLHPRRRPRPANWLQLLSALRSSSVPPFFLYRLSQRRRGPLIVMRCLRRFTRQTFAGAMFGLPPPLLALRFVCHSAPSPRWLFFRCITVTNSAPRFFRRRNFSA